MSGSVNKVIILGNITKDVEALALPQGWMNSERSTARKLLRPKTAAVR